MNDFATRLMRLPGDTLGALAFFSRIPVPSSSSPFDLRTSAGAWPLAGLILALGPALVVLVASGLGIPPLVTAFLAIGTGIALTGAMHEDGLSDTFDGIGGGQTPEERLAIMRDSRIGTFGALALILSVAIRGAGLAALSIGPWRAALALLLIAIVSRALALWHWSATSPARRDGMAFQAGQPDAIALQIGLAAGLIAAIALLFVFGFMGTILALILAVLGVAFLSSLVGRRIGGHTGDTIGCAQQIAETLLFVGLSSVSATIPL